MQLSRSQIKHDNQLVAQVASTLQSHMARYGYEALETPIIDSADLFLTSAGDQIVARLFTFERHGRQLALRPEFTAPAAYRYVAEHAGNSTVVRWQFSGAVFEDDPYDVTRRYQRFSVGAELIGLPGAAAESEMIGMAERGLTALGLDDWQVVIGHVGLMRHIVSRYGLHRRTERFLLNHRSALKHDSDRVLEQLDQNLAAPTDVLDPIVPAGSSDGPIMGGRTQQEIARRLAEKRQRASERQQLVQAVEFLRRWGGIDGSPGAALAQVEEIVPGGDARAEALLAEYRTVIQMLDAYAIPAARITIQPDLTRAWDYYTGIVFELRSASGQQVAGGGRYDELTSLIGGSREVPAVGFAYYFDPLLECLPKHAPDRPRLLSVITISSLDGARWATALRDRGLAVVLSDPDSSLPEKTESILVDAEGVAHLREKTYTLDQVADLISELGWEPV